jgi:outer membrane protein assembly factor BamB
VYVGSENGKLYAIDIDGNLRWTHSTDGFIYSSPAVSEDGQVYVCSEDGKLYALGPDGSELWDFETEGPGAVGSPIFASPAIAADGTVYIAGLRDPNLYALDPNDGSIKWVCHFESGGSPFASPVVAADGTIYQVMLFDPHLYAIESNTGTIIWSTDLADPESGWFDCWFYDEFYRPDILSWSEPTLGPDGTIYVSFNDPYLRAVNPDGSIKWVTRLGITDGFTLTTGSDGLIYAADSDGYLSIVDANGSEVVRFQSDGWLIFPVISADNTIIVSDVNNRIWAIGGDGCEDQVSVLHRLEDLDGSRVVDFTDFALLAADWLACTDTTVPRWRWMCEPPYCRDCYYFEYDPPYWDYEGEELYLTGDINRNLYVDFADLAAMTNRWLSED